MIDATELAGTVFSGLPGLVLEDVRDGDDRGAGQDARRGRGLPGCGTETARVHGYHDRTAADVLVGDLRPGA
jgi:hypothetical protein